MKCPNCRCVVPGSMKYCSYCGFRFDNGSARTVSVTEAYSGRLYREPAYYGGYGWSQELTANQYAAYSGGDIPEPLREPLPLHLIRRQVEWSWRIVRQS